MTSVSSDMKSILGVTKQKGKGKPQKKRKRETKKAVSRPSLYPTAKPVYKKRQRTDVRWRWEKIKSSARPDEPGVHHWVKFNVNNYRYAQFNKPINMLEYTNEEYDRYVHLDGRWTRQETDLLMKLCKEFGLRFVVIHDRYSIQNPPDCPRRTVEDLKDRFYSIQKSLLTARSGSKKLSNHPMFSKAYNKAHETDRKMQLEKLFKRTRRQEKEMAELVVEHRKCTQAVKRKKLEKRTRKKAEKERQDMIKSEYGGRSGMSKGRLSIQRNNQQIEQLRASLPPGVVPRNPFVKRAPGCYLRSTEPGTPLQLTDSEQQFVSVELSKLQFDKDRPLAVPTADSVQQWNQLRVDLATVHNLEKLVAQKEQQTEALKLRMKEVMRNKNVLRQNMQ